MNKDLDIMDRLFKKGIKSFNENQYYDAHELWEELWSDYYLPDANFVQGLIQLSVAYFHISNQNLKGAKSLFNKSIQKLVDYVPYHRGLNIRLILLKAKNSLEILNNNSSTENFNWDVVPIIEIND